MKIACRYTFACDLPLLGSHLDTMTTEPKQQDLPSAVEFEPPLACVRRILKNSLPSSTNVGKDASAAFARACGIFIIYVTSCANDFAREHKRQTITANDVLAAIKVSGSVLVCCWGRSSSSPFRLVTGIGL